MPRGDEDYAVSAGLRMLTLRRLVRRGEDGLCRAAPAETALLAYYANAIAETVALAEPAGDAREHALAHSAFA